jgi:hypothetical protein
MDLNVETPPRVVIVEEYPFIIKTFLKIKLKLWKNIVMELFG